MTNPNDVTVHFDDASVPARITKLEGGGGFIRIRLPEDRANVAPGTEADVEMHDGGRFRMALVERFEGGEPGEVRMKLLRRA